MLLDFVMPRMNGYQFCRELRSTPAHRALPVVLMSAKGDKIRGQFVQQTGAVDAITKPFDARALVAVIEGALAKTAEGRARPVPDGAKMPDEDTIADSIRPSVGPRQHRMKLTIEVAQQIANAVAPAVLALGPSDREIESTIIATVARAISSEVVNALATTLREFESNEGISKEVMGGDIAAIPLAEILQVLQMQRQTGVLRISNARSAVTISLRQGLVDFVQSRGAAEEFRLGRYFVEKGLVTREGLDQLILSRGVGGPPRRRARRLRQGQPRRAQRGPRAAVERAHLRGPPLALRPLLFHARALPPRGRGRQARLGVSGLVLEGFRRVDEWRLMEGTINFDQVIVIDQFALDSLDPSKLTRIDKLVIGAVDGARTVNEIIKESAVGSFDAIKAVYQFMQSRVLRPRAA